MITTGQARRLASEYSGLGIGMMYFSHTGVTTALARYELAELAAGRGTEVYKDPQGAWADARALDDWMDAHPDGADIGDWDDWDTTVVPWSYRRRSR
jgi:hypothetical protein